MGIHEIGRSGGGAKTIIQYVCDVCGNHDQMRIDHFMGGIGCNVCNNKKIVAGINDAATTDPDVVPYFKNPEEALLYCSGSGHVVETRCPRCGHEKKMRVVDIKDFSCPRCSDGISFPNRFVCNVLSALHIDFVAEATFEWSNKMRYDFYIPNRSLIIEVHGAQHYTGFFEKRNILYRIDPGRDELKKRLALQNGISCYVEIDARHSESEFIKQNLYESKLFSHSALDGLDWVNITCQSMRSIGELCLERWSELHDVRGVADDLHIDPTTVRKYLRIFTDAGVCSYDAKVGIRKAQQAAANSRKKQVMCLTTKEVFDSIKDAADAYGIKHNTLSEGIRRAHRKHETKARVGKNANNKKLEWILMEDYHDGFFTK